MENKDEIRLKTVRRVDPFVVQIVDSASRTALYVYDHDTESWSTTEIEGTLMIYSREAPPYNMILIMNRRNKTNFLEPLTPSCEIQVQPPFLLLRTSKGPIYGIWFSDGNVHRLSEAIRKITQNSQVALQPAPNIMNPPTTGILASGPPATAGGDIMSMLSRAHGDFESKRQEPSCIVTTTSTSSNDLVKPSPLRASESNNTNVADFFAKIGLSSLGASPGAPLSSPSSAGPAPSISTSSSMTNPVLQKLFQGAAAVGGQASVGVSVGSAPIPISGASIQTHSSSASGSVPSTNAPMSLEELEGKLKEDLHIAQYRDDPLFKSPTQQQQAPQQGAPSLLSPQVFTTSSYVERDPSLSLRDPTVTLSNTPTTSHTNNIFNPGPSLGADIHPVNGSRESLQDGLTSGTSNSAFQAGITPLTHEQLVQAFSILLKKHDFVQQLHEAYIQALNQSLKGCL